MVSLSAPLPARLPEPHIKACLAPPVFPDVLDRCSTRFVLLVPPRPKNI